MNTRRKFLLSGSLVTTAMLATKPFAAIAQAASPFTKLFNQQNNLVLLHTANFAESNHNNVVEKIAKSRKKAHNSILLNAAKDGQLSKGELKFDASATINNELSLLTGDYKIINKGGIKTGVITAKAGETDVVNKINELSAYLKKEKDCQIVVCLSQLGYKNKHSIDDITLAEKSNCLDVIIGGHSSNFSARPFIALNSKRAEVIIHSAATNSLSVGEIAIGFDQTGQKNSIWFNDPFQVNTKKLTA